MIHSIESRHDQRTAIYDIFYSPRMNTIPRKGLYEKIGDIHYKRSTVGLVM